MKANERASICDREFIAKHAKQWLRIVSKHGDSNRI
jgi:hypothetical protein